MNKIELQKIDMELEKYFVFGSKEKEQLEENGVEIKNLICIMVRGEGMLPTIKDKDYVVINKKQKELTENKVFMMKYQNQFLCRRISKGKNNTVLLKRDNQAYPSRTVKQADLKVIGEVVAIAKDK